MIATRWLQHINCVLWCVCLLAQEIITPNVSYTNWTAVFNCPEIFVIPSASFYSTLSFFWCIPFDYITNFFFFVLVWWVFFSSLIKCVCVYAMCVCLLFLLLFDYVVYSSPFMPSMKKKTGQNGKPTKKVMEIKKYTQCTRTLNIIYTRLQHWYWCVCVCVCFLYAPPRKSQFTKRNVRLCVCLCISVFSSFFICLVSSHHIQSSHFSRYLLLIAFANGPGDIIIIVTIMKRIKSVSVHVILFTHTKLGWFKKNPLSGCL